MLIFLFFPGERFRFTVTLFSLSLFQERERYTPAGSRSVNETPEALGFRLSPSAVMAPGEGGEGGGGDGHEGGVGGNGSALNGSGAEAVMPAAAAPPPPQQPQRAPGGFKIKVKLPPRQPSGDGGASVVGGGGGLGPASDANAVAASLKRPAEGPPADAGGAFGPPQKLKITLK